MGMKSLEQYRADFIDVIKRTMATNLSNKGVSASGTEALQALANKIANVNTGKKWASGTIVGAYDDSLGKHYVQVSGLSFTPSVILINALNSNYEITIYNKNLVSSLMFLSVFSTSGRSALNTTTYTENVSTTEESTGFYVYNNTFKLNVLRKVVYSWIAFE